MSASLAHKEELAVEAFRSRASLMTPYSELFERIHESWLAEPLEHFSPEIRELIQASFKKELAPSISSFFFRALASEMNLAPVVPPAALPESPCRRLVDFSHRQLVRLIAMLGLHDLAGSFRSDIDSKPQRRLLGLLRPSEARYLKWAMRQPDPLQSSALPLSSWGEERSALQQQMQVQGLQRLGKALAHEEPSLLWHVSHRFDKGRGQLLIQKAREPIAPQVSARILSQTAHLMRES